MPRTPVQHFTWLTTDFAVAPDGKQYAIFSEHVRRERHWYWPVVYWRPAEVIVTQGRPGVDSPRQDPWTPAGRGSTNRLTARRQAERHWHENFREAWENSQKTP